MRILHFFLVLCGSQNAITFFAASNFSGTKGKIRRALNKSRNVTIVADLEMLILNVGQYPTMLNKVK